MLKISKTWLLLDIWLSIMTYRAPVDFLYRGEANVYQENLDSFLAIAEELQLKGLMGQTELILNANPTPQEMNRKPFHKMETSNLNNFESKIDKWVKN